MIYKIRMLIALIAITSSIIGCNNSSSEADNIEPPTPTKKISIVAQSSLSFGKTKNKEIIELRQRVTSDNNQPLIIDKVTSLDNNCEIAKIDTLSFQVQTYDSAVCRFKYRVKPASSDFSGEASEVSQLVVNESLDHEQYLPPVSRTMKPLSTITFDDTSLLVEDGYEIVTDSLEFIGDTESGDIGSLTNVTEKGFTYTAPDTQGVVRIFYTEENINTKSVKAGIVYIAIGQNENTNPIALDEKIDPVAIVDGAKIIDVGPFIEDDDGDELQLVYVSTNLGRVNIASKKTIEYIPLYAGREYITYIVSDHNGGYGIGKLSFDVSSYLPIIDIEQELSFSPPYTFNDIPSGGSFTGTVSESGTTGISGYYPIFDKELAQAYCITQGSFLPSLKEMQSMRSNVLKDNPVFLTDYRWHSGRPFLLSSDDGFSLADGSEQSEPLSGYFSCVTYLGVRDWQFLAPIYKGVFNEDSVVFIGVKGEREVSLPRDDYNLATEVIKFTSNGIDEDPEKYLNIKVIDNSVNVSFKDGKVLDNVALRLKVTDPLSSNDTYLQYGISLCPAGTSPEQSALINCIRTLHGLNSEKFTLAMPDNVLELLGVDSNKFEEYEYYGSNEIKWRYVFWGRMSEGERKKRNQMMEVACNAMNELKIDGRNNWQSYSEIREVEDAEVVMYPEDIPADEHADVQAYSRFIWSLDPTLSAKAAPNPAGFVTTPERNTVFNASKFTTGDDGRYELTSTTYYTGTKSFMTCWSPD
ncbi:TPA: hypothetical protein ACX6QT_001226 [Photobacterium damselae]